ncbi:interferon regulatory factor 2-like [Octopus vulgaris]|uniref:Interferon regulatory factor 2-like n=1 Tax=Octopus vulgaris TaxID=6645 RepID=A0AA36B7U0_OCTVU|nr:interferon regulatory factor 2-like [Octopus vulgaris]
MASLPRVSDRNKQKKQKNNCGWVRLSKFMAEDQDPSLVDKMVKNTSSSSPSQHENCCNGHHHHHQQQQHNKINNNNNDIHDNNSESNKSSSGESDPEKVRESYETNVLSGEQSEKQQETYCNHSHTEIAKPAVKRRGVRPVERERMRPWLSRLLNVGDIPGLHWIDKKKKIFRIPWKHGSSQNWTPNDANLFVKWAEHTGRFVPTEDKPNTKRFKATFRCALNSLPDCKELSDLNHKGGTNAYKVYQFFCNKKNCPFNEDKEDDKQKSLYREIRPKSSPKRNHSVDSSMSCNSLSESDSSETLLSDSEVANTLLQLHRGTIRAPTVTQTPITCDTSSYSNPTADAVDALTQLTRSDRLSCPVPLPVVSISSPPELPVTTPIAVTITQPTINLLQCAAPTVVPLTPPAEVPLLIQNPHLTPQNPFFPKVTESTQSLPVTSCPKHKLLSDHCYIDDAPLKPQVRVKEEVNDPGYSQAEQKTMMPLVKVKLENVETGHVIPTTCWKNNEENNQEGVVAMTGTHFQSSWKCYQPTSNLPTCASPRNLQVLTAVNTASQKIENSSHHTAKIPVKKKRTISC